MKRFLVKLFGAIWCFGFLVLIFKSMPKIDEVFGSEFSFIIVSILFFFWVIFCSKLSSYIDKKFSSSFNEKDDSQKGIKFCIVGFLASLIYVFGLIFWVIVYFCGYFLKYPWASLFLSYCFVIWHQKWFITWYFVKKIKWH